MPFVDGCLLALLIGWIAFQLTRSFIDPFRELFCNAGLIGKDLNKKNQPELPEAMGLVAATAFFMTCCSFLPIPFVQWSWLGHKQSIFPLEKVNNLF